MSIVGVNGKQMGAVNSAYERALASLRQDNDELRNELKNIRNSRAAVEKYIGELNTMLDITVQALDALARAQVGIAQDALRDVCAVRPDLFGPNEEAAKDEIK